jgi:hypothetical protein
MFYSKVDGYMYTTDGFNRPVKVYFLICGKMFFEGTTVENIIELMKKNLFNYKLKYRGFKKVMVINQS